MIRLSKFRLPKRILAGFFLFILIFAGLILPAAAYEPGTLYNGCEGDEVRKIQQALIDLGYLKGTADGVFGNKTENAVRAFQKKNRLDVDGLVGPKTKELILKQADQLKNPSTPTPGPTDKPTPTPVPSSGIFGGNYTTIRMGQKGDRVKILQNALITVGSMSGKADGVFGKKTFNSVKKFQKKKKLTADGVAGKKTLLALEKAVKKAPTPTPEPTPTPKPTPTPAPDPEPDPDDDDDINAKIKPPKLSKLKLLHWFNDVKPSLSNGQNLLIYDPDSGLSWTLRILARGRHCDAEPLTAKDTHTMVKAFGGVNTWNQKPVYVKLPGGTWTVGSTHDMPHQSGNIKDNDFNGHLCVHFLRDMDEAKKNDPKYGVANQETIRDFWKKLTGETIP